MLATAILFLLAVAARNLQATGEDERLAGNVRVAHYSRPLRALEKRVRRQLDPDIYHPGNRHSQQYRYVPDNSLDIYIYAPSKHTVKPSGGSVHFDCEVTDGFSATWARENGERFPPITETKKLKNRNIYRIEIDRLAQTDGGIYICRANTGNPADKETVFLEVSGSSYVPPSGQQDDEYQVDSDSYSPDTQDDGGQPSQPDEDKRQSYADAEDWQRQVSDQREQEQRPGDEWRDDDRRQVIMEDDEQDAHGTTGYPSQDQQQQGSYGGQITDDDERQRKWQDAYRGSQHQQPSTGDDEMAEGEQREGFEDGYHVDGQDGAEQADREMDNGGDENDQVASGDQYDQDPQNARTDVDAQPQDYGNQNEYLKQGHPYKYDNEDQNQDDDMEGHGNADAQERIDEQVGNDMPSHRDSSTGDNNQASDEYVYDYVMED